MFGKHQEYIYYILVVSSARKLAEAASMILKSGRYYHCENSCRLIGSQAH